MASRRERLMGTGSRAERDSCESANGGIGRDDPLIAIRYSLFAQATPARSRSWKCTTPTGLPASTTISCVFLVELSSSSASLTS
jgi:hypothetical protein